MGCGLHRAPLQRNAASIVMLLTPTLRLLATDLKPRNILLKANPLTRRGFIAKVGKGRVRRSRYSVSASRHSIAFGASM